MADPGELADPGYPIRTITNGVHPETWTSPAFRTLFDHHIPDWRLDPLSLRYAVAIPLAEIEAAHVVAKQALIARINQRRGVTFSPDVLTLGFARRATAYKRATLLFSDLERLAVIAETSGPIQIVFAGKAHPNDEEGKSIIRKIYKARSKLRGRIEVVYLPNYNMELGALLTAGSDVWLNTPTPPLEASGTSGMKSALNGVPSLSVLDGWWVEGCVEGVTGWAIGVDDEGGESISHESSQYDQLHAEALYKKLSDVVIPCFYKDRERFLRIMRSAISMNASFFNTHRMVIQYFIGAYRGT